jgi:hypothetical protein
VIQEGIMDIGGIAELVARLGRVAVIVAIAVPGTLWLGRRIARFFAQMAYERTFGAPFRLRLPATCAAAGLAGIVGAAVATVVASLTQTGAPAAPLLSMTPMTAALAILAVLVAGWFIWSARDERKRMLLLAARTDPLRQRSR